MVEEPDVETLHKMYNWKRQMVTLRKLVWSLREMIGRLYILSTPYFRSTTGLYPKNAYDDIIQVIDVMETYRYLLLGVLEIHLSSIRHRMNEILNALTIIVAIIIPLTLITGVYGMNFRHIPELVSICG